MPHGGGGHSGHGGYGGYGRDGLDMGDDWDDDYEVWDSVDLDTDAGGLDESAVDKAVRKSLAKLLLAGNGDDDYDQGYRDAFKGDPTKYDSGSASAAYKKGYETGEHDSQ